VVEIIGLWGHWGKLAKILTFWAIFDYDRNWRKSLNFDPSLGCGLTNPSLDNVEFYYPELSVDVFYVFVSLLISFLTPSIHIY
jgi:hypothetical protein